MAIKQIARQLRISKNTVKAKLAADAPPKYERAPVGSVVDEVEPRVRGLLRDCPTMPATVIAERIGWTRGPSALVAAALVLYLVAVVITIAVNVPLNDAIKAAGDPGRIADLGRVPAVP